MYYYTLGCAMYIFISEANEEEGEGANEEQEEDKGDDGAAEVMLVCIIGSWM